MLLAAAAVAVLHGAAVLLVVAGGLLALRRPRVLLLQVPVGVAIAAVFLAGADCPLTALELALRERAGLPVYEDGFLAHYALGPLGLERDVVGPWLPVVVALPNLAAAAALLSRRQPRPVRSARSAA